MVHGHFSPLQKSRIAPRWGDSLKLTTPLLLGVFTKPAISAHPGPHVRSGENMTLHYHSLLLLDKFILHKKKQHRAFLEMWRDVPCWASPADFFIGPMTADSAGTYRCYGSLRHCPYEWSAPSDPVDLIITGECGQTSPFCSLCHRWSGVQSSISTRRE